MEIANHDVRNSARRNTASNLHQVTPKERPLHQPMTNMYLFEFGVSLYSIGDSHKLHALPIDRSENQIISVNLKKFAEILLHLKHHRNQLQDQVWVEKLVASSTFTIYFMSFHIKTLFREEDICEA